MFMPIQGEYERLYKALSPITIKTSTVYTEKNTHREKSQLTIIPGGPT